jgi:hypothetical protein
MDEIVDDNDTLAQLKQQRALIDAKLSFLTREKIISFHDTHDTLSPLPTATATPFQTSTKQGISIRARRGRDQVLHHLSTSRGATLASPALLHSMTLQRTSFQTATTAEQFIRLLKDMLQAIQQVHHNGRATATPPTSPSLTTNPSLRTPVLVPWAWMHAQRGTSCNEDFLRQDVSLVQLQKDVERDQYIVDGVDVPGSDGLRAVADQVRRALIRHAPTLANSALSTMVGSILWCASRTHAGGASYDTIQYLLGCHENEGHLVVSDVVRQTKTVGPISIRFGVQRYLDGWGLGVNISVENCFQIVKTNVDGAIKVGGCWVGVVWVGGLGGLDGGGEGEGVYCWRLADFFFSLICFSLSIVGLAFATEAKVCLLIIAISSSESKNFK